MAGAGRPSTTFLCAARKIVNGRTASAIESWTNYDEGKRLARKILLRALLAAVRNPAVP
jgi:hypothetical protein